MSSHVSRTLCVCLILFDPLLCTLHRLSHLPSHSLVIHLHLPCGLVRLEVPCVLPRMRILALWPRTILSHVMSLYIFDNNYETTDFFIQESSSGNRPSNLHDLEFDDNTIGRALSSPLFQEREDPASRRQVYHSLDESLLSSQSSSVCHVRTGRPVNELNSPMSNVRENPRRDSENEQIRILLERQKSADSR